MLSLLLATTALTAVPDPLPTKAEYERQFAPKHGRLPKPKGAPPGFTVSDAIVAEDGGSAVVKVTKSGTGKQGSKIQFSTGAAGDTATAGADYRQTNLTIAFSNTDLVKVVTIPITDDAMVEGDERFTVTIAPVKYATIAKATAQVTITDNDAQPPDPAPGVGEPPIADNFDSAAGTDYTYYGPTPPGSPAPPGRGGLATVSGDPVGAFRMFCKGGQLLKDDPLVYPGQPGVSHTHQFIGNDGTTAASNYESLRTTGGTGCGNWQHDPEHPLNRSSYWFPAMKDGAGSYVKPDYMNLYYKRMPKGSAGDGDPAIAGNVGFQTDLPNGIRFVFGYNMKTGAGGPNDIANDPQWFNRSITFQCWGNAEGTIGNGGASSYYRTIDAARAAGCPAGARLMIVAAAPNCWDGHNVDSADHRSHMHNSDGPMYAGQFFQACPPTHPYAIPNLEVQIAFTTDANFVAGKWHLSSDEMVSGAVPGSTWHMDYWEAWSPAIKATWLSVCIDGHLTCASGDLGNGTAIRDADYYPASAFPKHQLVPETSVKGKPHAGAMDAPPPAPGERGSR